MTCVVGLIHEGKVWMGCDSAAVDGWALDTRAEPKVFVRGPYMIGYTTSFRMGQILRFAPGIPVPDRGNATEFMATKFVEWVRTAFRSEGFIKNDGGREEGGVFMVGVASRLFCVYEDFHVAESTSLYAAIGSGRDLALGALAALSYFDLAITPAEHIRQALMASEKHNAGVRQPFHIGAQPNRARKQS